MLMLMNNPLSLIKIKIILCSNNEDAYAGQLNNFTHLRALLVLHDRSFFWPGQLASKL
jgi:hypothetical protein